MNEHLTKALSAIEEVNRIATDWNRSQPYTVDVKQRPVSSGATLLTMIARRDHSVVDLDRHQMALYSEKAIKRFRDAVAALKDGAERMSGALKDDPLWCLYEFAEDRLSLHKMVVRLGVATATDEDGNPVFFVDGPGPVEHGKEFFAVLHTGKYKNVTATIDCSVAFAGIPMFNGTMFSATGLLWRIGIRVFEISKSS